MMERYAPYAGGSMIEDPNGPLVKYDDAQRAIAEVEHQLAEVEHQLAQEYAQGRADGTWLGYEQGQRDMLDKARDMLDKAIAAVEALEPIYRAYPHRFVRVSDILATLRALSPDGGE